MAATESLTRAAAVPRPPELLPGRPDAIVDLQTEEGVALVGGEWRYADARVEEIEFVELGAADDPLAPGTVPNRTYDVVPHAEAAEYDDSGWRVLAPDETMLRLANGRVCFNWYRLEVTIPERVGDFDPSGSTVVFEIVIDDYAEVWVDGALPFALGDSGGHVVAGFNAPNRVVLTRDARPGERFQLAVLGINGPISASPRNYIWVRGATLDFYAPERVAAEVAPLDVDGDLARIVGEDARLERIAGGFDSTDGPVWLRDGSLLFSSPRTNTIYRWVPAGRLTVFRTKSGYSGVDVGRHPEPGAHGLALSPDGLLTICQHGNRRVLRVNPHGDTTVLADGLEGPRDLVYGSDGTLFLTDIGGVHVLRDGELALLTDELDSPRGMALSADERRLYVASGEVLWRLDPGTGEAEALCELPGQLGGLAVDRAGELYVCGAGGIHVVSAAGALLGTLRLPEEPSNLAWGDDDARTLYVTAETSVYRLRLDS